MQTFDARPILAEGGHPLEAVNAAWAALPVGQRLGVIAPFEPAPMMAMFSAQGVAVQCQQKGPGEYWLLLGPKPC